MPTDPFEEIVALARENLHEEDISRRWEAVVRGEQPPDGAPTADIERELFRPLDSSVYARLTDLILNSLQVPLTIGPVQSRVRKRVVLAAGVLAAAAALLLYLVSSTRPARQEQVPEILLSVVPEVTLLGGQTAMRTADAAIAAVVDQAITITPYPVVQHSDFQIEIRIPGAQVGIDRIIAHCPSNDVVLEFIPQTVIRGLSAAKVHTRLSAGIVCEVEVQLELDNRRYRLPAQFSPRINVIEDP